MHRVEEVEADEALGPPGGGGQLGHGERGGVGREDRLGLHDLVEAREVILLHGQLLDDRLDHQVGLGQVVQTGRPAQALEQRAVVGGRPTAGSPSTSTRCTPSGWPTPRPRRRRPRRWPPTPASARATRPSARWRPRSRAWWRAGSAPRPRATPPTSASPARRSRARLALPRSSPPCALHSTRRGSARSVGRSSAHAARTIPGSTATWPRWRVTRLAVLPEKRSRPSPSASTA